MSFTIVCVHFPASMLSPKPGLPNIVLAAFCLIGACGFWLHLIITCGLYAPGYQNPRTYQYGYAKMFYFCSIMYSRLRVRKKTLDSLFFEDRYDRSTYLLK